MNLVLGVSMSPFEGFDVGIAFLADERDYFEVRGEHLGIEFNMPQLAKS